MIDPTRAAAVLSGRAGTQAARILQGLHFATLEDALSEIRTSSAPEDLVAHFEQLLTERADALVGGAAAMVASEAVNLGRQDEAAVYKDQIETATYSAILDKNTCDPCASLDGQDFDVGSAEYFDAEPPNRNCEGGDRCRCIFVYTLAEERPSGGEARPAEEPAVVPPAPPPIAPLPDEGTPLDFARVLLHRATATEPEVSRAVREIATETDGRLAGYEFRLKRIDSLERKVAADVHELTAANVEPEIRDALRYTTVFDTDKYTDGVRDAMARMKDRGFDLVRVRNNWTAERLGYQGINTVWRAPNGQLFEMQYHTPVSIDVKERLSHPLYEKARIETDPARLLDLKRQIEAVWQSVPLPPGVLGLFGD